MCLCLCFLSFSLVPSTLCEFILGVWIHWRDCAYINASLCFCIIRACVCHMLLLVQDSLTATCVIFRCTYNGTGIYVYARVSPVAGSLYSRCLLDPGYYSPSLSYNLNIQCVLYHVLICVVVTPPCCEVNW